MTTTDATVDGRRLRRDRNRETVVQALLALYRQGNLSPSTDEIAERAGISSRSLFRYFDDVDTLVREVVAGQQEHLAPLFALTNTDGLPLDERIHRFVAERTRLLEAMGPVGQVARAVSHRQPVVATELARIRAVLRDQVLSTFADALGGVAADDRLAVEAALDVITSWEAHHLLRVDRGLGKAAAGRAMATSMRRLLASEATA